MIENYKQRIRFSWWWKCTFQDGGCRLLGLRKTAAISLGFARSSTKLVETFGLRTWTWTWNSKNCCYFITHWPIIIKFSRNLATLFFSMTSTNVRNHYARCWLQPSSIRKTAAISLLFDWSSTKFVKIFVTLTWNISMTSEMHICKTSRWRSPPSWISKNGCHVFTIWPIKTKFRMNIATMI